MAKSSDDKAGMKTRRKDLGSTLGHSVSPEKITKKAYMMPAPIMKRLFAFIIDMMILNLFVLSPFNSLVSSISGGESFDNIYQTLMNDPELMSSLTSVLVVASIIVLFYFIILQKKFGQTLGMMIMDIYAIKLPKLPEQNMGAAKRKRSHTEMVEMGTKMRLGFVDVLLRNIFLIPFFPFIFLWFFDPMYLFFSKTSQRLMEYASNTMTVTITAYDKNTLTQQRWL